MIVSKAEVQGKYSEAEALFNRALTIREKALGANHRDVGTTLNNLGLVHAAQRKYSEAEGLYKRALAIRERALGANHPDVALIHAKDQSARLSCIGRPLYDGRRGRDLNVLICPTKPNASL